MTISNNPKSTTYHTLYENKGHNVVVVVATVKQELADSAPVCRHQILTYKDDPRTERVKIFIMAMDP